MINHLTTSNSKQWKEILKSIHGADCYAMPELGRLWESSYPYRLEAVWAEYDGQLIFYPFIIRPISELPFGFEVVSELGEVYDITSPEYGGIFHNFEGEMPYDVASKFSSDFGAWCRESGIITEFGRIQVIQNNIVLGSGYNIRRVGRVVWVDLNQPEEQLQESMSKEGRKKIRQAISRGVEVRELGPEGFADFIPLYHKTMDHHTADDRYLYPSSFFESMVSMPSDFCFILGAYCEGELAAAVIVFVGGGVGYSYLSATDREYQNMRPNNLLFWEALIRSKQMGCSSFVLGGGASSNDGTYQFKLNFSDKEKDFYIYDRTHDIEKYRRIIEIKCDYEHNLGRDFNPESVGFFPIYRAVWRSS